jgi:hypothetical protein
MFSVIPFSRHRMMQLLDNFCLYWSTPTEVVHPECQITFVPTMARNLSPRTFRNGHFSKQLIMDALLCNSLPVGFHFSCRLRGTRETPASVGRAGVSGAATGGRPRIKKSRASRNSYLYGIRPSIHEKSCDVQPVAGGKQFPSGLL